MGLRQSPHKVSVKCIRKVLMSVETRQNESKRDNVGQKHKQEFAYIFNKFMTNVVIMSFSSGFDSAIISVIATSHKNNATKEIDGIL